MTGDWLFIAVPTLGEKLASLGFAGLLIIHLLQIQVGERERWLQKDDASDAHLRDLVEETNQVLSDMRVVISELKEVTLATKRKD